MIVEVAVMVVRRLSEWALPEKARLDAERNTKGERLPLDEAL